MATDPSHQERPTPAVLVDELTRQLDATRRLLTEGPGPVAAEALDALAPETGLEARLAASLAAPPLADADAFPAAHRLAVRALEILDREAAREIPVSRLLGPLRPLASLAATFVAEYVTRSYARDVATRLATLYARREVQAPPGTPERRLLAAARAEMHRLLPGFTGGGASLPALLAGGAAVPLLASAVQYLGAIDFLARPVIVALFSGLFVLTLLLSSLLLTAVRHAHRRCTLVMRQPLHVLWEAIGDAGTPPEDHARAVAIVALVLAAGAWLVIPALGAFLYLAS